ncbi:MAG: hypothetical protein KF729_35995 [Sandaracinaceae bacterium]|nr:hypothetical protein [Sandaracinaceae bacterium]
MTQRFVLALASLGLVACDGCGPVEHASAPVADPVAPGAGAETSPEPVAYEVHEWGLVRGTSRDQVMLSGPHQDEIPVPLAKPVLYFHRSGDGPLTVRVDVTIPDGRVVEHWPLAELTEEGARLRWPAVAVTTTTCSGARYPAPSEPPCDAIHAPDACEAATLATVETREGACLEHGGARFDHLFYRAELRGAPALPLTIVREGTALRVTHAGGDAIAGSLVRVRRGAGRVTVAAPPAPGGAVVLAAPEAAASAGAEALGASLSAAGLTPAEVMAFRRAWDRALFGGELAAAGEPGPVAAATPMGGFALPPSDDALLYVLPAASADALAGLSFTPAPRGVRRAIVAWIDVEANAPARP